MKIQMNNSNDIVIVNTTIVDNHNTKSECFRSEYVKQKNIRRVGGIVFDKNTNLLIVYGKKSKKWGLPKGHIEGSESLYHGALREIKEETGINLDAIEEQDVKYINISKARLYIFHLDDEQPELCPQDTNEICTAIWADNIKLGSIMNNANKMLLEVINKLNNKNSRFRK